MWRRKLSAPARWLKEEGLITGSVLDFGCGRGYDADELGATKYDPVSYPTVPLVRFDTILCIYVLNVVDEIKEERIIRDVQSLLKPGGKAYFVVRRDRIRYGVNSRGDLQRWSTPDLISLYQRSGGFEIYVAVDTALSKCIDEITEEAS